MLHADTRDSGAHFHRPIIVHIHIGLLVFKKNWQPSCCHIHNHVTMCDHQSIAFGFSTPHWWCFNIGFEANHQWRSSSHHSDTTCGFWSHHYFEYPQMVIQVGLTILSPIVGFEPPTFYNVQRYNHVLCDWYFMNKDYLLTYLRKPHIYCILTLDQCHLMRHECREVTYDVRHIAKISPILAWY